MTSSPYVASDRPEIREFIPPNAVRFLDVGCNDGSFGAWLKSSRQCRVVGIEPNESQAVVAAKSLDAVVQGFYPESIDAVKEQFDCITFNHVLEHICDPWEALRMTKRLVVPGGCVVSLIPTRDISR
jgi:2-polyprenyl-3-methyl-5-hydroxy-6-metoxy-1,4-benzoquinol methylase